MSAVLAPHVREVVAYLRSLGAENVRVEHGGKHLKVRFEWSGRERYAVIPATPGDTMRGTKQSIKDIRHMLGLVGGAKRVGERRVHRRPAVQHIGALPVLNGNSAADWRDRLLAHPVVTPSLPTLLNAAWRTWWRDLAARNGHRSRL